MPQFPQGLELNNQLIISTASPECLGAELKGMALATASANWTTLNRIVFVPVTIYEPIIITRFMVENGTTIAGNIDIGLYNQNGLLIVSSGATLQSGTSFVQPFDIPATQVSPGLYYMAMVMTNITGSVFRYGISSTLQRMLGCYEQLSTFPLPSTGTFAACTVGVMPVIYMSRRSSL